MASKDDKRALEVRPFAKGEDITQPPFREKLNALVRANRAKNDPTRNNWRPKWVELQGDLDAPDDGLTDPTTADAKVIIRGDDGDYLVSDNQTLKVTNRFEDFSAGPGDRLMVERIKGEWWPRAVTEDYQLLVPLDDLDPGDAALCDVYGNDGDVLGGETPVTDGEDVLQLWGKNCTGAVIEAGMRCDKILRPWGRGAAPVGAGEDAMDLYELVPTACDPVFEVTT